MLRLTPEMQTCAAEALDRLVAEIDALVDGLSSHELEVIRRFLVAVADVGERQATRLTADADAAAHASLAFPLARAVGVARQRQDCGTSASTGAKAVRPRGT